MGKDKSIYKQMSVITIDTSQLSGGADRFKNMSAKLSDTVDDVLNANMLEMEEKAKRLAPADRGMTRQQISADLTRDLIKEITVNTFYAAYMEFGTGVYAAQYAASLPSNWHQFAQQFKGKAGGTFAEMLVNIEGWVKRKGIGGGQNPKAVAYVIARSILKNGVRPQPFLYPAYVAQNPQLIKDLETALNAFGR